MAQPRRHAAVVTMTERAFTRLPARTQPGDQVTLTDGRQGTVDTCQVADDLRDTKCTVLINPEPEHTDA